MIVRTAMRIRWVGIGYLQNFLTLTLTMLSKKSRMVIHANEMASVYRLVSCIFLAEIDKSDLVVKVK